MKGKKKKKKRKKITTLWTGFEPVRVEPIGFQVQLLNHSDTTAVWGVARAANVLAFFVRSRDVA